MQTKSSDKSTSSAAPVAGTPWNPTWWKEETHGSAWDRVKEAMTRDWQQTKHDLAQKAGHALNQTVVDTVKQIVGKEPLPPIDRPNPPKVIGELSEDEQPIRYGFGARHEYGQQHPTWSPELETKLKADWMADSNKVGRSWQQVQSQIRYGYEHMPS
jgi:hypothetical protein